MAHDATIGRATEPAVAAEDASRQFRLDNEVLAFRFAATVSHRAGSAPFERLVSPERMRLWMLATGLDLTRDVSSKELATAIALREAIYRAGSAIARAVVPSASDVDIINTAAAAGRPVARLVEQKSRWMLDPRHPVTDALAVIAADAIAVLGTSAAGRVKTCEGVDCAGLFLDTSRGGNRRWCSMNTCGNKAKKSRMARH
ncbi:CGNR zinc finger domain-containing protein [Humibacter ginsenosidimutans]|uniref:Zinc finger CGNR domain-containing protein n=1 Tax=Humibacter ginsenosidimutans TaxID=2599293 RepID=A0A5B8M1B4_9MICO|nr:ABATE domain-containing protein [Humibacter ginsenosidimutans]QDZ13724.1 hypothetical protein FPZ11_01980 [Humibacter ginsenosidimutans]